MAHYRATVHLLFELNEGDDSEGSIADALNAILTEQMRKYSAPHSCLIDWAFDGSDATAAIAPVSLDENYEPDETPFPHPFEPDPLGEALNSGDGTYRP